MTLNNSGIYKIVNNIDGKVYYGSAFNFFKRWKRHKDNLNKNKHPNQYLQNAWNFYNGNNFSFEIALVCDKYNCLFYEQLFLNKYFDSCVNCYNICSYAKHGPSYCGSKNSNSRLNENSVIEIIKHIIDKKSNKEIAKLYSVFASKISSIKRGTSWIHVVDLLDDETRQKFYEIRDTESVPWNKNRTWSLEERAILSAGQKKQFGRNNSFYGKKHTAEVKEFLSKSRQGMNSPCCRKDLNNDLIFVKYQSGQKINDIAKDLKEDPRLIKRRLMWIGVI